MKKLIYNSILVPAALMLLAVKSFGQTAELQVIHNAADPAAATVDVYVNGALAIDDFTFRTATSFLTLPAGVPLNIGVAPGNSVSVNDTLKNFTVTLASGDRYIAVANGVLNPANFAVNPDGNSTAFTLFLQNNIRNMAMNGTDVDFVAVHGASDAPSVDVIARTVATIVNDASYGDITGYVTVPPANYVLDVTPAAGAPIVASFQADLSSLGGGSAVVFASGFLDPSANQNGASFGLFAALANGTVVTLPATSQARLQVIHNAADPGAAIVDVYVNGSLLLDNFAFRTATPFIFVPAGVVLNIGVAAGNSTSVNDTLKNFEVTLQNGNSYIAVANGVLNPANFSVNPDGKSTAFTLFLQDQMRENAVNSGDVDFRAVHGASDAPTVDVIARTVATLVDDASYSDITGYVSVPPANYILDVTPAAGSPIVASFQADLSSLGGGSAVVFASGFLDPSTNQNGAAFGLFAALANGTVVTFPATSEARLQVIHNAADPGAAIVDVYVNGNLLLDDFAFRSATPYISVPAGVVLNIGVAAGNSTSVNDTLKNFEVTLQNGNSYIAVANGVLNPANFGVNPDGQSTAFTLFLQDQMRETAVNAGDVDFRAVHGASDAPTVDVIARTVATLVDDASYGDITGYVSVPPANYILDVTPAAGSPIVASFQADLSSLGGGSAVVFASGFLDPSTNQNGAAFGLFAALANGTVVTFPATSEARLQVIHNAADPGAAIVDVYVNGNLLLDDFAFRSATPYISVPAGVVLNIGVAAGNSTSVNDTLKNFEVTLQNGNSYIAVANGVLNPANFAVNPDGQSTAFTLFLQDQMRETAVNAGDVDFRAVHGASDAPTVDVIARTVATLVNDASYGAITGYVSVPPANYILDVTPASGSPIVASFQADLSSLGGGSAVVFASGFLDPSTNQNGAAFGLFAALANGTVVTLPASSQARLQVIHNAADPGAASVDVYVNGNLLLDDFAFRTATPYIFVPADVVLNIGVAAGNSTSVNDTLKNFEVTLQNGNSYIAVANGVLNPANFAVNPDGQSTAFTLFLQDQMRETAVNAGDVDLRVVHGASDAPTVDVLASAAILVDNAQYSNITPYLNVPAAGYTLNVTPGNDNSVIVASFSADLTSLGGNAAVVLASGFLDPSANQNGASFGLIGVLPNGTVVIFSNITSLEENNAANFSMYPNPANDFVQVNFTERTIGTSTLTISNTLGQELQREVIPAGLSNYIINTTNLSKGLYFIKTNIGKNVFTQKLIVE